jgi:hypothetical protein
MREDEMPDSKKNKVMTSEMTDKLAEEVHKTLKEMKDFEMKGDTAHINLAPKNALWSISGSYKTNS